MLLFDNLGNVKDERHLLPRLNIVAAGVKTYLYLTGQGGTENGGLEGNLRQSGGQLLENAERVVGRAGAGEGAGQRADAADLLAGRGETVNGGLEGNLRQSGGHGAGANPGVGSAKRSGGTGESASQRTAAADTFTGRGETVNGGLEDNLRQSGGQSPANAAGTENPQGGAAGEHLLSGYDWYNNDVARGEAPRLIQSS